MPPPVFGPDFVAEPQCFQGFDVSLGMCVNKLIIMTPVLVGCLTQAAEEPQRPGTWMAQISLNLSLD